MGPATWEQNVAVTCYENNTVEKCEDGAAACKKLEPYLQIDKFQWNMVDNDTLYWTILHQHLLPHH